MSDVVIINGEPISSETFETFFKRFMVEIEENEEIEITKENKKYLKTEALNHLIERTLFLQQAKSENIEILDSDVFSRIDEIKATFDSENEWKNELKKLDLNEISLFEEIISTTCSLSITLIPAIEINISPGLIPASSAGEFFITS